MEIDEARAGQHVLDLHARASCLRSSCRITSNSKSVSRGERRLAGFGREDDGRSACGMRSAAPRPVPGPTTSTGPCSAARAGPLSSDRVAVVDVTDRMRDRFEIVDDRELADAERSAQARDRHRPRQVDVDDRVVDHVARDRERDAIDIARRRRFVAERIDDRGEARIIGAGVFAVLQDRERRCRAVPALEQCDARMRAADVGRDQRTRVRAGTLALARRSAHSFPLRNDCPHARLVRGRFGAAQSRQRMTTLSILHCKM